MKIIATICIFAAMSASACAHAAGDLGSVGSRLAEPEVVLQHADDRADLYGADLHSAAPHGANLRDARGTIRLDVTCSAGIGRATLTFPAQRDWPRAIVLRLRYAPRKPYPRLEGFQVDGREADASMRRHRGWLEIRVTTQGHDPSSPMQLQWIDHYR